VEQVDLELLQDFLFQQELLIQLLLVQAEQVLQQQVHLLQEIMVTILCSAPLLLQAVVKALPMKQMVEQAALAVAQEEVLAVHTPGELVIALTPLHRKAVMAAALLERNTLVVEVAGRLPQEQ